MAILAVLWLVLTWLCAGPDPLSPTFSIIVRDSLNPLGRLPDDRRGKTKGDDIDHIGGGLTFGAGMFAAGLAIGVCTSVAVLAAWVWIGGGR